MRGKVPCRLAHGDSNSHAKVAAVWGKYLFCLFCAGCAITKKVLATLRCFFEEIAV
jgi:hypothetical protein